MAKLEPSTEVQGDNIHWYRCGGHANSQANLPKGQWKLGHSGNANLDLSVDLPTSISG